LLRAPVLGRKHIPPRCLGACEWILKTEKFISWLNENNILIINGPLGSGKSVMASFIVNHLQGRSEITKDISCVLHFFFNKQADIKSADRELLDQFLLQLIEVNATLARHFPDEKVFRRTSHSRNAGHWPNEDVELVTSSTTKDALHPSVSRQPFTIVELVEILISMLRDPEIDECYVVFDGIDECDEASLNIVILLLEQMKRIPKMKICLSFLSDEALKQSLKPHTDNAEILYITEEIGYEGDLEAFKKKLLNDLMRTHQLPADVIMKTQRTLHAKNESAYLWINLVTSTLERLPDLMSVQRFLRELNKPSSGHIQDDLNSLYTWIFKYLNRRGDPTALAALCLVVVAKRPLTVDELSMLLAVWENLRLSDEDDDASSLNSPDTFSDFRDLICSKPKLRDNIKSFADLYGARRLKVQTWLSRELYDLLSFREDFVSLVHPTLKDSFLTYLTKTTTKHSITKGMPEEDLSTLMAYVQRDMAGACLVLLCIPQRDCIQFKYRRGVHYPPIDCIEYAALNWYKHLGEAGSLASDLDPLVMELWKNVQLRHLLLDLTQRNRPHASEPTLSCLLSAMDLRTNLRLELTRNGIPTERRALLSPELRYAAANSSIGAIKELIELEHDITIVDECGWNIMDYALWTLNLEFAKEVQELTDLVPAKEQSAEFMLTYHKGATDLIDWMQDGDEVEMRRRQGRLLLAAVIHDKVASIETLPFSNLDSKDAERALERAVEEQMLSSVERLIKLFLKTQTSVDLTSSLTIAAKKSDYDIATLLLRNGASSNGISNDRKGASALHYGASTGRMELVQLLVTWRARTDAKDSKGRRPIHWAAKRGHSDIVKFLLSPATSEVVDMEGRNSLFIACKSGSLETVRVLLNHGVSINKPDNGGKTPLHLAVAGCFPYIVDLLIARGADPNSASDSSPVTRVNSLEPYIPLVNRTEKRVHSGNRPLHEAAISGQFVVAECLIKAGADVNARNHQEETPLHLACCSGNPSDIMVQLLIDHGADVYASDQHERQPLHIAAMESPPSVVQTLMTAITMPSPNTAATKTNNVVRQLAAKDSQGRTALHLTALSSRTDNAYSLLGKVTKQEDASTVVVFTKLEINLRDHLGRTALHYAAECAPYDLFDVLLSRGADLKVKDNYDKRALQLIMPHVPESKRKLMRSKTARLPAGVGATEELKRLKNEKT
jgi:ankyrin repeat protein